ncbi:CDP-alcohol phosphatidyltransferase family protein [Desulfobacterota bacterium M19]
MLKRLFVSFVRWIGYDLGISPNQVTIGRLLCFIPGWLIWYYRYELAARFSCPWQVMGVIAILIVGTVIAFDIVDGALARETGQVSDEGKILDPLVDKVITYSTLGLFLPYIVKPVFYLLLFLDICSTFMRGSQGRGANQFGKRKAFSQNVAKLFFGLASLFALPAFNLVGNLLLGLAAVLASISVSIRAVPPRWWARMQMVIPQLITLCNVLCGILAIWLAVNGRFSLGAVAILTAMLFDLGDGAVARKLGVSSNFGKQFDTIADMVSFGLAPAVLAVAVNDWRPLAIILGAGYFLATLVRLYDYGRSKDITPAGFFRGLPSPAGAWLVVASVLFPVPWLSMLVMVAAAVLMCLFVVNWIHFNQIIFSLTPLEIFFCLCLGLLLVVLAGTPEVFAAGPIVIYALSPKWRKPHRV